MRRYEIVIRFDARDDDDAQVVGQIVKGCAEIMEETAPSSVDYSLREVTESDRTEG